MKAEIKNGMLRVIPENHTESYALKKWFQGFTTEKVPRVDGEGIETVAYEDEAKEANR